MSNVPEVLKPEYFFDMDLVEYKELFEGVSFVWEVVKTMQEKTKVDEITQSLCNSVNDSGSSAATVIGNVNLRVADGAKIAAGVTISGDGGCVSIDSGADIRPGTVIIAGKNKVYIGSDSKIGPNAHIDAGKGSVCVGNKVTLRQGAYLREV